MKKYCVFYVFCFLFFFQTFIELTSDNSQSVPCQAGFVPPLPSFQFEPEPNDLSLGSSDSNTSESWHTSPPPTGNDDLNSSSGSSKNFIQYYMPVKSI